MWYDSAIIKWYIVNQWNLKTQGKHDLFIETLSLITQATWKIDSNCKYLTHLHCFGTYIIALDGV